MKANHSGKMSKAETCPTKGCRGTVYLAVDTSPSSSQSRKRTHVHDGVTYWTVECYKCNAEWCWECE